MRVLPRAYALGVGLVLGLGTALRVWRIDLAQVNFDESNVASLALAWKHQAAFPLAGTVSSVGIPAPPGWPWAVAAGLWFSDDPLALIATGVIAGVAALFASWWVGYRWLGPWGGVGSALFYGTAFYAVLLGRGAWQPLFLQLPLFLCLDALLLLVVRRRPWAAVAAFGWFGILLTLHYTTIAYSPLLLIATLRARRVLRPIHLGLAPIAALLPLIAFLSYEARSDVAFRDLGGLLGLSGGAAEFDLATVISVVQISSTQGASGLGGHASVELALALGRWTTLSLLGPLLAVAGLVVASLVRPKGWVGWLLVTWTLLPVVVYLRHGAGVLFHYMYIEFPGLALAVGALLAWVVDNRSRAVQALIGVAIACYTFVSTASMLVVFDQLERLDMRAGYGIPIGYSRAAGRLARSLIPPGGHVLIGDDQRNGQILRFTVGYDVVSRTFDDCRSVPFDAHAVYLLASERTPGASALEAAGAPLLGRVPRPGGDAYRVYGSWSTGGDLTRLDLAAAAASVECADRRVWEP